jgi:hypothetical protein
LQSCFAEDEFLVQNVTIYGKEMPKPICTFIYIKIRTLLRILNEEEEVTSRKFQQNIDKINNGYLDYIKTQKDLKCFDY